MSMAHTTTPDPAPPERPYPGVARIRRFDERTAELFVEGLVKGTAHSYVGEEAVATAVCAHLRPDDAIVGNHRGHGHCIAKGASLDRMMAELMGRETGYCRGLGGSMHIAALDLNILGCNGIVGAGGPIGGGGAGAGRPRAPPRRAAGGGGGGGRPAPAAARAPASSRRSPIAGAATACAP